MTIERVLWGVAITGVVAGTALRIVPASTPAGVPAVVPALAPPPAPSVVSNGSGIVAANIFAPNRSAPPRRVAPRGADQSAATPAAAVMALYGTTVTADDAFALIEADPQVAGAEIYRVGDLVQGARLMKITDSTVTLASPPGGVPRVLRLPPAPTLRRSM